MVHVRSYVRERFGRLEFVREHWRSYPVVNLTGF